MTSIKPPVFPAPTATDVQARPLGTGSGVEKPAEASFTQALGRAGHVGASDAVGSVGMSSVEGLARELEAGRLTPEQALEHLVERAAASVERSLSAQERSDLLEVLRAALASDPTLAALRDSL